MSRRSLLATTGAILALVAASVTSYASAPSYASVTSYASAAGDSSHYAAARSTPHRDSVYPGYGNTVVDALHYGLDLRWNPTTDTLTGTERLVMRAARASAAIPLDLSSRLALSRAVVNGHPVAVKRSGHRIDLGRAVRRNERVRVTLTYSGVPRAVRGPSSRSDMTAMGFNIDRADGSVWTTQEPYGAFTWYAVNDQPADKAFYDVTLHVPAPMVGVSNGALVARRTAGGMTTTRFHLAEPAASYLITLAFGRYTHHDLGHVNGVHVSSWVPTGATGLARKAAALPTLLRWLNRRLGRFPFPTLGILVVPGDVGMETQQTITIGETDYDLSKDTLLHEISHQWYGDEVTPADWSDLWMNEGMAMYLQTLYLDSVDHVPAGTNLDWWSPVSADNQVRRQYGPPAAYDRSEFAENNVYLPPARMWQTLRHKLGEKLFWRLARTWPRSHAFTSTSRQVLATWWSNHSGRDLHPFFHAWLFDKHDPVS